MAATIKDIAKRVKMDEDIVRRILLEDPMLHVERKERDKVFDAARKLGYDLTMLRAGKRIKDRGEMCKLVLKQIEANPEWGREEILAHLRYVVDLTQRHHKRAMPTDAACEE